MQVDVCLQCPFRGDCNTLSNTWIKVDKCDIDPAFGLFIEWDSLGVSGKYGGVFEQHTCSTLIVHIPNDNKYIYILQLLPGACVLLAIVLFILHADCLIACLLDCLLLRSSINQRNK
jgi:hypothetical protein